MISFSSSLKAVVSFNRETKPEHLCISMGTLNQSLREQILSEEKLTEGEFEKRFSEFGNDDVAFFLPIILLLTFLFQIVDPVVDVCNKVLSMVNSRLTPRQLCGILGEFVSFTLSSFPSFFRLMFVFRITLF